jgi:predicted glycoside hydrolase/deacetylase ChbG (UPF0249 family)
MHSAKTGLLIVNADDWGRTIDTTDHILECFSARRITSTTAMVYMADSDRAAATALDNRLAVGLHLNLTENFTDPATPPAIRERQARIVRRLKRTTFWMRWLYNPIARREIELCIADQFDRFNALYRQPPTHFDGHQDVHIYPNVALSRTIPSGMKARGLPPHPVGSMPLHGVARGIRKRVVSRRFRSPEYFFGIRDLHPRVGGSRLMEKLALADAGSVEVMTHPGVADERLCLMSEEWQRALTGRPMGSFADL